MGLRRTERRRGADHITMITRVKFGRKLLPAAYDPETIPAVGEGDELETLMGSKKQNLSLDNPRPLSRENFRLGNRRASDRNVSLPPGAEQSGTAKVSVTMVLQGLYDVGWKALLLSPSISTSREPGHSPLGRLDPHQRLAVFHRFSVGHHNFHHLP